VCNSTTIPTTLRRLIGEASHGTHEFYAIRAELTKRLTVERGFEAVAVEADWPDAYRANRWVRGSNGDASAETALSGSSGFPDACRGIRRVVRDFLTWLRSCDERNKSAAGFYGIELYSLHASRKAVVDYLERVDPEAAKTRPKSLLLFRSLPRPARLRISRESRFGRTVSDSGTSSNCSICNGNRPRNRRPTAWPRMTSISMHSKMPFW
jgi:hypothetical protein